MTSKNPSGPILKAAALACVIFLFSFCSQEKSIPEMDLENRETILDRKVHIEPELVTEVPYVERWCERLDLKKHRVKVGDAELYVEEEGRGTPLVLIHGGPGGTHHCFHPWFSRARKYARVIYYDQRGCGLSDFKPGEEGYSVHQAVEDLDALRKALDIEEWVVLGYSYGGFLAQLYTASHPENAAGLVLLGSSTGMHVDTGESRQHQYISDREEERLKEIRKEMKELSEKKDLSRKEYIQILLYNKFLNGDWKRQHFIKPTQERLSQIALYEWDHDKNFNSIMSESMGNVDLKGAFEKCPVPTLILEGKYDLTWGEKKREVLKNNHPNARMIVFEKAGHGIYKEQPEKFFSVLKDFIKDLPEVSPQEIGAYKASLETWRKEQKKSAERSLASVGWGWHSSKKLAHRYSREWLGKLESLRSILRTGFALYDVKDYEEALFVFERMEKEAAKKKEKPYVAMALIWRGHMLDLLGRREEAVGRYRQAAEMNLDLTWMHSQYRMKYSLSPYARERMKTPFQRIENHATD
ncbi:alpha/beta hydrolase [bacterium]|nr:alpha/beta hydrolase [bacterium]